MPEIHTNEHKLMRRMAKETIAFLTRARDCSSVATLPDDSDTCGVVLDLIINHTGQMHCEVPITSLL